MQDLILHPSDAETLLNAPHSPAPKHFTYYPGNDRWSAEMLAILSTAPYGGAEISEVDRIGRGLRDRVGDATRGSRRGATAPTCCARAPRPQMRKATR